MTVETESKLLYTIKEIFDRNGFLSEKGISHYNIPGYQRGYKWESANVIKLLSDIDSYGINNELFYCIQNITLVKAGNLYNVIDGQQRLTTLIILLSFLEEKELIKDKVQFPKNSIREYTNKILHEWISNIGYDFFSDEIDQDWERLVEKHPEYDLQDIYHIVHVAWAIKNWFGAQVRIYGNEYVNRFKNKLLNHVMIIVNEVNGTQSEERIFGNLNSKRIPLDGADLVRAILITRVAREEAKDESDLKSIIFVNERRIKLGWELDQMSAWWNTPYVKEYFDRFVNIKSGNNGDDKIFNEVFYPINRLYSLYAESQGEEILSLELFENSKKKAIKLYKELLKLHHTLYDWYSDRKIYHLLGYLFANSNKKTIRFKVIWDRWEALSSRHEFIKYLHLLIKDDFIEKEDGEGKPFNYADLDINWYFDRRDDLIRTLILMDVIESLKDNKAYIPPTYFKRYLEDVEHIFPQTPRKASNEDIRSYMSFLGRAGILGVGESDDLQKKYDLDDVNARIELEKELEILTGKIKHNSIGNLVLLDRSLNRSISNQSYSEKRSRMILHHNEGNYIQPHTFKVFVRDFVNNNKTKVYSDNEYWLQKDINDNSAYINRQITNFFDI